MILFSFRATNFYCSKHEKDEFISLMGAASGKSHVDFVVISWFRHLNLVDFLLDTEYWLPLFQRLLLITRNLYRVDNVMYCICFVQNLLQILINFSYVLQLGHRFSYYWTVLICISTSGVIRSIWVTLLYCIMHSLLPLKICSFAWSVECVRFSVLHFIIRLSTPTWVYYIFSFHVHFMLWVWMQLSKYAALLFFLSQL